MTAHAGMACSLPITLHGAMSPSSAAFGHYRQAPPEIPVVDDLGFLDELAAELDGGVFDVGDLLLDDLQLPAAGARAASTTLVPPSLAAYIPAPLVVVLALRSASGVGLPPNHRRPGAPCMSSPHCLARGPRDVTLYTVHRSAPERGQEIAMHSKGCFHPGVRLCDRECSSIELIGGLQAASGPDAQAGEQGVAPDTGHALRLAPRSAGASSLLGGLAQRTPPAQARVPSNPEPFLLAQGPLAFPLLSQPAATETATGMARSSQPLAATSAAVLPGGGSLLAPLRTIAAADPGAAAPLTTSQQHRLLMDFLADQEARSNHRLAELQQQQTAFIQQQQQQQQQSAAQCRDQVLPGGAPARRRRVMPVASPFKRQETDQAAGPASITEDRLQQRERRQVWTMDDDAMTACLHGSPAPQQ